MTLVALLALGTAYADDAVHAERIAPAATVRTIAQDYLAGTRDLVLHAMGFLGVRYRYGGDSPHSGFDCSGLVRYVVEQALGLVLPRNAQAMAQVGTAVRRDELEPGDLVFFNTLRRPYSHVGIYVGDKRFIHVAVRGGGVEVADMRMDYWQRRYNGARRIDI